jgi:mono/diheme cytochrome c family protein
LTRAGIYTVFAFTAFCAACAQNTGYQQDPGWRAPSEAAARPNPLAKHPEAAAGGEKLFKRNCIECHGDNGTGLEKKHAADLQLPTVQEQSDGTLFWKITNGNPDRGMPSFSRLPELQRWQIVLYLRKLKSGAEVAPKGK